MSPATPEPDAGPLGLAHSVTASLDLDVVLAETLAAAMAIARCPVGALYLLDEAEQRLWIRATSPGFEWLVGTYSLDVGAGLTGWTALNRTPAVVNDDPHDDPRYISVPEVDLDFRSALTIPLVAAPDHLVGVLTLHARTAGGFTTVDVDALSSIAGLAAAAIARAQLVTERRRLGEFAHAIAALDDPVRTPASARAALRDLVDHLRELLASRTIAVYTRGTAWWRLEAWSTGSLEIPQDEVSADVLEPFTGRIGPARIARQHHKGVFEALAPGAGDVNDGLISRLESGGEIVGVLVSVGQAATTTATDRTLFEIVAGVCALIAQGRRIDAGLATRLPDEALLEALDDGTEPAGAVAARAQSVGVDLEAPHTVAAFHVLESAADGPEPVLDALRVELDARLAGAVVDVDGVELLLLSPAEPATAVELLEHAVAAVEGRTGARLVGGVSTAAGGDAQSYARGFSEARDARRIAKAVGASDRIVEYRALGVQGHLWALARSAARDPFQDRLRLLRDHDLEHGSELLASVEAYLEEHGHKERTAARLHVHRNTLRLRLERIRELTGLDLDDRAVSFDVQTALGILRFRELERRAAMNANGARGA